MRLRDWEAQAIRQSAVEIFGTASTVRLFGSRVHDDRRGGDIDLYVDCGLVIADEPHRLGFSRKLRERLGERAIDIVYAPAGPRSRPIDLVALAEGVIL